jgi:hypothetical protein
MNCGDTILKPFNPTQHGMETPVPINAHAILDQAAIAYRQQRGDRPSAATVVDALLHSEKQAKQHRTRIPLDSLLGRWQLCCATGVRKRPQGGIALKKGFYLPTFVPAYIQFQTDAEGGHISNQVTVAGFTLRFTGPLKYIETKNLLAFDFTQMQVSIGALSLYRGTIPGGRSRGDTFANLSVAQLPFFSFFWTSDNGIAARGRGGGVALWVRAKES